MAHQWSNRPDDDDVRDSGPLIPALGIAITGILFLLVGVSIYAAMNPVAPLQSGIYQTASRP